MSQASKAERRLRRKGAVSRGRAGLWVSFHPSDEVVGTGVVMVSPKEVLAALETLPPELAWPDVADRVVPLFERMRPYPAGTPPLARVMLPPGVLAGFGIDIGPAFVSVSAEMLHRWGLPAADVAAQALVNLHRRAAEIGPEEVFRAPVGDVESVSLQADHGIGSALVLAPSELARIFGRQPRRFIAPMRSVLVGLPIGPPATDGRQRLELPVQSLAVGEYVLRVEARRGDDTASELTAFRVIR